MKTDGKKCHDEIVKKMKPELGYGGKNNYKEWKEKGIPKYIYYYPYNGRNHLYGYYENYYTILSSKEVFVGEAEKFVQQLDSMGINNALAISKKTISPVQLNLLLKLLKKATDVLAPAGFDIEIVEKHHNLKVDAPSGTALALADSINEELGNEYEYVSESYYPG